jgi:two-component system response regulator WspF
VRIAIVNDSLMAVEALRRALQAAPEYEIIWIAANGAEAVANCAQDRPSLILMDLAMPVMDGVQATRQIMAQTPCPILIVTATVNGRAAQTFEALGAGAIDAISTPILGMNGDTNGAEALITKIRLLEKLFRQNVALPVSPIVEKGAGPTRQLVVIGASAGGPGALATILSALPSDFSAGIVIVQHVDAVFAPPMAEWLNSQTTLDVRLARNGDRPQPGLVLLAGTDNHLVFVNGTTLSYTQTPANVSYRPSIDVLFASTAQHWTGQVAGVLLTGMGKDGATGLKTLRGRGALTIAQDSVSSVVYGMPKAAIEMGAAVETLPLSCIATRLKDYFQKREHQQKELLI